MGLTIHYGLTLEGTRIREARKAVEALRQRALDLPFEEVGDLIELRGDDCAFERVRGDGPVPDDEHRWFKIQAGRYVDVPGSERDFYGDGSLRAGCSVTLSPVRIIGFSTWPGPGSEAANFGLCLYPGTVEGPFYRNGIEVWPRQERRFRTDLGGRWSWGSFCKTHYASHPECGGLVNFLRCHLVVVSLLDAAQELGLLDDVHDEGKYWKERDIEVLSHEIGEQSAQVAAFVGLLNDNLPDGIAAVAPITSYPEFEHLEAKGAAKLPAGTLQLVKLLGPLAKRAAEEAAREAEVAGKENA